MNVQLFLTPFPLHRADLQDRTVLVIDVLRSSTSICAALSSGARGIIPTAEPGESAELRSKLGADNVVLAGEREGVKIENFQHGNSPTEFTPEVVKDKNVILCTTNGTGIFGKADAAAHVISGGLVNITLVCAAIAKWGKDLVIVCSGRQGGFSIEDTLCGGMVIDKLNKEHGCGVLLDDAASLAQLLFREMGASLGQAVAEGEHGRFLASIGLAGDIEICTAIDSIPVLPVLQDGRLVIFDQTTSA